MATKRGRKKGYCPYVSITYESLGEYLGNKGIVKVSRAWLEELGYTINESQEIITDEVILHKKQSNNIEEEESKIEYKLTHFE
jgi:hypothetical protein